MAKIISRMVCYFRAWRKSFPKWFGVSAHGESHFLNGLELVVAKIWKYSYKVVMPARVRKPKDKALVEDAVKLTYARIYPELKEEDPTPYLKRAKEIDPVVEDFLQIVIERKKSLLAACKSCKGILSFENKVGKDRLIAACKYTHKLGVYNYLSIANILTKGLDRHAKKGTGCCMQIQQG